MKTLSLFLAAGVMLMATPIAAPIDRHDPEIPVLSDEVTRDEQAPPHFPSFHALLTWNRDETQSFPRPQPAPVPEPDTFVLLAGGLLVAAGLARKKARREVATVTVR